MVEMASDDRYAMAISRIIAGQLASEQGFEEVQQSALDILADLLNRYILEAGNRTHLLTELSRRTDSTAIDVAQALKNMGHDVTSMTEFLQTIHPSGFVHSLTKFPVSKSLPSAYPSFASMKETPPPHIPDCFPAFPDEHALKETAEFYAADNSAHAKQAQVTSQQQQAEEALLYLQARETTADDIIQTAAQFLQEKKEEDEAGLVDEETTEQTNKFLSPPVWESMANDNVNGSMPLTSKAGATNESNVGEGKIHCEWQSLQNSKPFHTNYNDWQWTKSLEGRASLSTISLRGNDAFTQEAMDGSGTVKRRTLLSGSEMLKARVQELVTSREEEAETYMMVDEQLPQEQI